MVRVTIDNTCIRRASSYHRQNCQPRPGHGTIEDDAFALAVNTITQSAQPVPATIRTLTFLCKCTRIFIHKHNHKHPFSLTSSATSTTSIPEPEDASEVKYVMVNMPAALLVTASRDALMAQNAELRYLLDCYCFQMQRNFTLKKLMDKENERSSERCIREALSKYGSRR
jgi:hypothetical protein